jgi:4-diphosphocytidyl-2-C-methyl-D-erythritol kinase
VEDNLVLQALAAVRAHEGRVPPDDRPLPWLDVRLDKRIPMGAGLGGGSADAAAALTLLGPSAHRAALEAEPDLPARLGADVPFFASGASVARMTGLGERIERLPSVVDGFGVLLVVPPIHASTPQVYATWDRLGGPHGPDASDGLADALRDGLDGAALAALAGRLRESNDLWPAAVALVPRLAVLRDALESTTARPILLTGSGSSLFAIYPSAEEASDAGRALAPAHAAALEGCRLFAVDDAGAAPAWRFP